MSIRKGSRGKKSTPKRPKTSTSKRNNRSMVFDNTKEFEQLKKRFDLKDVYFLKYFDVKNSENKPKNIKYGEKMKYYDDDGELYVTAYVKDDEMAEYLHDYFQMDLGTTGSKMWDKKTKTWEWFIG